MESNSGMKRMVAVAAILSGFAFASAGCGVEESDHPEGLARGDRGPEVLDLYQYLRAYGYFPNPALEEYAGWEPALAEEPADVQVFDEVLERALVLFQQKHGLPADGVLNEPTRQLMKMPRCGFPDFHQHARDGGAPSFTPSGYRWPTGTISYSYSSFTPDLPVSSARSAIDGAFARWAAVAPLTFTQLASGGDIAIGFYSGITATDTRSTGPAVSWRTPSTRPAVTSTSTTQRPGPTTAPAMTSRRSRCTSSATR